LVVFDKLNVLLFEKLIDKILLVLGSSPTETSFLR